MPLNSLTGRLRRPAIGIGQTTFPIELEFDDLEGGITRTVNDSVLRALSGVSIPIFFRGPGGGGGGGGPRQPTQPRAPAGPATRFSAYGGASSFYGGPGGGFGSFALGGTRLGFGGAAGVAGGVFAAGALADLSRNLIEASASFETFQRTVQATEPTMEAAEERWQRLLDIANETVGIDVAGLVQYNSQLRVIGVEAERVDAILRATVRSVSELGRGAHVSREALNQLTDGIVRNHLNVRDWRAIVARVPQFLDAASRALGRTVLSVDDFNAAVEARGIQRGEGIIRSLEELDRTARGLEGTYVAAMDRVNEATLKLKATLGEDLKDAVTPVLFRAADGLNALNEALSQTPGDRLRRLYDRLEEVRGGRTVLGDSPLEREAQRELDRFRRQYPELFDTSAGRFRALEAASRQTQRPTVEQPTQASLEFFENVRQNRLLQQEFLRSDLQRAGGNYADQLATTERQITETVGRLRSALNVDTQQQTATQQQIVQGLQSELDTLFQQLPVLRELAQERERELRDQERLEEIERRRLQALDQRAQIQRNIIIDQHQGFFGIGVGTPQRTATREARRQREAQTALNEIIRRNFGFSGLGVSSPDRSNALAIQQALSTSGAAVNLRRIIESQAGYASILTGSQARIPSQAELDRRTEQRFRELRSGRGDTGINRLVGQALGGGPEGLDSTRLRAIYDQRIEEERRAVREAERASRRYTRIWTNAYQSVADAAIGSIFNRNLNFAEALQGIAQQTLSDLTGHFLNQFLSGGGSGGFGAATASGAGIALSGAGLLFPNEFNNLFSEITNSLSRIPRLFHSAESDLYARTIGARTQRAIEGNEPTSRQNARDFSENFGEGFQQAARDRGGQDGVINLTINVADLINNSDEGLIQLSVRIRDLQKQGLIPIEL